MADDSGQADGQHASCCNRRDMWRRQKVEPAQDACNEFIDIPSGHRLRVKHLNGHSRDDRFKVNYKRYLTCVQRGVPYRSELTSPQPSTHPTLYESGLPNGSRHGIGDVVNNKLQSLDTRRTDTVAIPYNTANTNQRSTPNDNGAHHANGNQRESSHRVNGNNLSQEQGRSDQDSSNKTHEIQTTNNAVSTPSFTISSKNVVVDMKHSGADLEHAQDHSEQPNADTTSTAPMEQYSVHERTLNVHNVEQDDTEDVFYSNVEHKGHDTVNNNFEHKDTVIFFLHGVGGSSDVWHSQMEYFVKLGYEVVSPDFIGHGMSSAPNDPKVYEFSNIMEHILAIFDRYCNRSNIIVGHSYGSSFATVLARKRCRWIEKLIMINGGGPTPLHPQPGVFQMPACLLHCFKPVLRYKFRQDAFHDHKTSHPVKEKAFDIPSYVLKYVMNGQNWLDGGVEYHQWIRVHTLLIYGIEDQLVSYEDEVDMQQAIFGSHLELIEKAGHMVMMEQPQLVSEIIHKFIEKGKTFTPHKARPRSRLNAMSPRPGSGKSPRPSSAQKF